MIIYRKSFTNKVRSTYIIVKQLFIFVLTYPLSWWIYSVLVPIFDAFSIYLYWQIWCHYHIHHCIITYISFTIVYSPPLMNQSSLFLLHHIFHIAPLFSYLSLRHCCHLCPCDTTNISIFSVICSHHFHWQNFNPPNAVFIFSASLFHWLRWSELSLSPKPPCH